MASALYDKGRQGFLDGSINWSSGNIRAVLVDTGGYTLDLANHQFLSDIPGAARIATSGNLASKTVANGIADAADVTFPTVSGASVEGVALYQDTGVVGTSRLIAWIDSGTGIPITPNGGDITLQWDNGTNKIFKL